MLSALQASFRKIVWGPTEIEEPNEHRTVALILYYKLIMSSFNVDKKPAPTSRRGWFF